VQESTVRDGRELFLDLVVSAGKSRGFGRGDESEIDQASKPFTAGVLDGRRPTVGFTADGAVPLAERAEARDGDLVHAPQVGARRSPHRAGVVVLVVDVAALELGGDDRLGCIDDGEDLGDEDSMTTAGVVDPGLRGRRRRTIGACDFDDDVEAVIQSDRERGRAITGLGRLDLTVKAAAAQLGGGFGIHREVGERHGRRGLVP
jgi:hypothetical protein